MKKLSGGKHKNLEFQTPKMHPGTIKKYLTETQNQILCLLKKHMLEQKNHPISIICQIFRENFGKAYEKYSKPSTNPSGGLDKAGVIRIFKQKTKQLQSEFIK